MPQIGWFEILIVVVLSILIIGPKDFPFMIKKIGTWVGSFKNYFTQVQRDLTNIEDSIHKDVSFEDDLSDIKNKKNKDE